MKIFRAFPIILVWFFALDFGRTGLLAQGSPYAINPFRVAYRSAPTDPAQRWAGFQSRVGTYLPTDQYHWWRFDPNNRAEVQDAYWNITAVADTVLPQWNGSWSGTPGDVAQTWRDAFMRCLNLQRYYYMRGDATYLEEDTDATRRLGLQAAALIEGIRPAGYTHSLTLADMPVGFQYSSEAIFWAAHGNLGWNTRPSTLTAFLDDAGNLDPGHRLNALNPGANLFAFGRTSSETTFTGQHPYPTVVFHVSDTTYSYQSGSNFGNPDPKTCPPPPQYDPFDYICVYPYRGYVANDDIGGGGTISFSIDMPCGGLMLDAANLQASATRDGNPVSVSIVGATFNDSWRSHVSFAVAQGYFPDKAILDPVHVPYSDGVISVALSGLRFSTTRASTPTGRASDVLPYIAASNPEAFQPHTLTWSFTVFDPAVVQPVDMPAVKTEITNLSTRAAIGAGNNVMIAGFIITGNEPLRVVVRARGPSLAQFGIQHPAVDPAVEIYQMGATNLDLGGNDNWKTNPNWRLIQSYNLHPEDDRESAAVATLMPGAYSAIVSDSGNSQLGVGIVEVFALDAESQSRLYNVSTRALVGAGENVLIGGFYVQKPTTVVVRTQGPTLARWGLEGVSGTHLKIVRQSDFSVLASNHGWNRADAIGNERLHTDLAGYAPADPREAAQVITLSPGAYTALVESADGNPGIGIVEVFNVN